MVETVKRRSKRAFHLAQKDHFVFKNLSALVLVFLGFLLISSALIYRGDLSKSVVILLGLLVLLLSLFLIIEFAYKTSRAQVSPEVVRYSAITAINTLFGLALPLWIFNIALNKMIIAAAGIRNYGSFFCQIRCSVVDYYYDHSIYWQITNLITTVVTLAIILFIFGPVIERLFFFYNNKR